MAKSGRAAILALSMILYACGGDGSGGGGPAVVVPPPPPPVPPPPPPPPPPPTVTAVGPSDMLPLFHFYPNSLASGNIFWSAFGDRQGRYRPITPALMGVTSNFPTDDYATLEKIAFGIDVAGVSRLRMTVPRDVLVISPVTTLLASGGPNGELIARNSEAKLETQLGISGSLFGLAVDRPITTFSPGAALLSTDSVMVADGERMFAHHIRVMAIAAAVNNLHGRGTGPTAFHEYEFGAVARYLDTAPASFLYTNQNMSALLGQYSSQYGYRADVLSAAAHLVNAYAAAIGVRIAGRQQAGRFTLGIWGYMIPELTRLLKANDAATAAEVLAINSPQILDATARYAEQLPFDVSDNFFPAPDFFQIAKDSSITIPAALTDTGRLNNNDVHVSPQQSDGNHFYSGASIGLNTVTAVTVPQSNTGEVTITLNADGSILVRPAAGFTGVTYCDYTVTHVRGDVEQGRAYIRVR